MRRFHEVANMSKMEWETGSGEDEIILAWQLDLNTLFHDRGGPAREQTGATAAPTQIRLSSLNEEYLLRLWAPTITF